MEVWCSRVSRYTAATWRMDPRGRLPSSLLCRVVGRDSLSRSVLPHNRQLLVVAFPQIVNWIWKLISYIQKLENQEAQLFWQRHNSLHHRRRIFLIVLNIIVPEESYYRNEKWPRYWNLSQKPIGQSQKHWVFLELAEKRFNLFLVEVSKEERHSLICDWTKICTFREIVTNWNNMNDIYKKKQGSTCLQMCNTQPGQKFWFTTHFSSLFLFFLL